MKQGEEHASDRRSFIRKGMLAAGAATAGVAMLGRGVPAFGQEREDGGVTKGDIAILQLLLAAEIIETDLWQQYRELGGVEATGGPSQAYITALQQLDGDMPQYISDNTDDEISHVAFLTAYLKSIGQTAGQSGQVPDFAQQRCAWREEDWTPYKSDAVERGHQLVDPVPQHGESRSPCEVPAGSSEPECRARSGNSNIAGGL
jgi:hypothetical protein